MALIPLIRTLLRTNAFVRIGTITIAAEVLYHLYFYISYGPTVRDFATNRPSAQIILMLTIFGIIGAPAAVHFYCSWKNLSAAKLHLLLAIFSGLTGYYLRYPLLTAGLHLAGFYPSYLELWHYHITRYPILLEQTRFQMADRPP